jgi:hypothetical protein
MCRAEVERRPKGLIQVGVIMSSSDLRFYGFISGCLLVAALFVSLLLGGESDGHVDEFPSHQIQHR